MALNLDEVLEDLRTIASSQAEEKGLKVVIHVEDDVPRSLVGDPLRLGQILTNLVGNAIKLTDSGEVRVDVRLHDPAGKKQVRLVFSVRDTGIGMPPGKRSPRHIRQLVPCGQGGTPPTWQQPLDVAAAKIAPSPSGRGLG